MGIKVKSALLEEPGNIHIVEREVELKEDEVLVKWYQASLCDSDRMYFRGHYLNHKFIPPTFYYPFWLGHEGGGVVMEIGSKVREFKVGDKVSAYGRASTFSNMSAVNIEKLQRIPDDIPDWLGAMGEPIAVPTYAAFDAPIHLGDVVAVTGMGFNSQIMAQIAKKSGAYKVICIDDRDKKLELAKRMGADYIINSDKEDVLSVVKDITNGKGADVVLDGTGYAHHNMEVNLNIASSIVKDNGAICVPNWYCHPITVDMARWHHNGIDMRFPALMHHGDTQRRLWIEKNLWVPYERNMIDVESLITARYPLSKIDEALKEFDTNLDVVKILIDIDL